MERSVTSSALWSWQLTNHTGLYFAFGMNRISISLDEVQHFLIGLKKEFAQSGQLIATSHHPETIRVFASDDILVLQRNSHLEPTVLRNLKELDVPGDKVGAIARGDVLG